MAGRSASPRSAAVAAAGRDEALAEVLTALAGLGSEIRTRFAERPPPVARRDPGEWEHFINAARHRVGTLGMSERTGAVDSFGMDDAALARARPLLDWLVERYWRLELLGLEHLPGDGPSLLVANRSGVMPYDGLIVSHALARERPAAPRPRFLVADWLMHQPFAHAALARLGGVRACRDNAVRLLAAGRTVLAFPEGVKGAAKTFRERYQLKRFARGGVVRVALESQVPLVPVGIVGAEEAHPILFKVGATARSLGLPFLPVTPTFPWLGPLGLVPLPTKWVVRIGEPFDLGGRGPEAAEDDLLVARLTEELRTAIQGLIDDALADRASVWS
jgi:1-acyl-sn-glycerol-3-phosphate acyltransferase